MVKKDYSIAQLMTCVLARDLEAGDRVAYGLHASLGLGAALLAQKLYVPELYIRHGFRWENDIPISASAWSTNKGHKGWQKVAYWESHDELLRWANASGSQTFSTVFFVGGMQIDRFGAINLIGIKKKQKAKRERQKITFVDDETRNIKYPISNIQFKVRGPGSIGTPSATFFVHKYYIFSLKHDARVFVPEVDFVSVPGTNRLRALGYPDKKPRLCVTPLGVFDWENKEGTMQIVSLHPGVSFEEVQDRTGFELAVKSLKSEAKSQKSSQVPKTKLPTAAELRTLQEIDSEGKILQMDVKIAR